MQTPGRTGSPWPARVARLVGLVLLVVSAAGLTGCGGTGSATPAPDPGLTGPAAAFLQGYVDPDGRVVRRDQGGDTVSEGQAYALLVAVGSGDAATFRRVWGWTRQHLLRPDGTLSWRWADGAVVDASSASDADLDAARALVLAGKGFGDLDLLADGLRLGRAVLDVETVETSDGRVLTAGSWATTEPWALDPSYASPAAYAVLGDASGDTRWADLAAGSRAVAAHLLTAAALPPDWAQVHADGRVEPVPGAAGRGGQGVRYGYDATRFPLRQAESCSADDRALAARLVPALEQSPGSAAERDLGGRPLTSDRSVVGLEGEAAALAASGDLTAARDRMAQAETLQQQSPTYYGGAWAALGPAFLTSTVLGGCAVLPAA
ncbi:MAG: glycosyl hydrolase family 8 [Janthinobacterium lividum]